MVDAQQDGITFPKVYRSGEKGEITVVIFSIEKGG
jgi:hypothetical protein